MKIFIHIMLFCVTMFAIDSNISGMQLLGRKAREPKPTTQPIKVEAPEIIPEATEQEPETPPAPEIAPPPAPLTLPISLSPKKQALKELIVDFKTHFGDQLNPRVAQQLDAAITSEPSTLSSSAKPTTDMPIQPPSGQTALLPGVLPPVLAEEPSLTPEELLEQQAVEAELREQEKKAQQTQFGGRSTDL